MTELYNQTVCVVDNGLFTSLAETLAPSFLRTYYYSSWEQSFPRSNAMLLGEGLNGVQRIQSIWPLIDEIDLFVFPDILHGQLQLYLQKIGKRVWGSRDAENLELLRAKSKQWLADLGLEVGPYKRLVGMKALRGHLLVNDDRFVKVSKTRGDMETFHAASYDLVETRLDELDHAFGAKKDQIEFVVEEPIDAKTEVGFDGFTIDGRYPSQALYGVEKKDAGYVGEVVPYLGLPESVRSVNAKLSPLFRQLNYRGFWSSEIRVTDDGVPYLIDPCCRMASPPGELYQYLVENLAEIIWNGSKGNLVEPIYRNKYGAQLVLKSGWAEQHWQPVEFPPEIADQVKLHYETVIDGRHYYVPQQIEMPEIGSVVAGGHTREEAMANVIAAAEQIKGYDIKFDASSLDEASKQMDELKDAA
jgi:hypothetical protein